MKKNEIELTLSRDEARMLFLAAETFHPRTPAEQQVILPVARRLREAAKLTAAEIRGAADYDVAARLYDAAGDTIDLDDLMIQAEILWRCADDGCRWNNPGYAEKCENCELPKGAEPADEEPDEGDGSHDFDGED